VGRVLAAPQVADNLLAFKAIGASSLNASYPLLLWESIETGRTLPERPEPSLVAAVVDLTEALDDFHIDDFGPQAVGVVPCRYFRKRGCSLYSDLRRTFQWAGNVDVLERVMANLHVLEKRGARSIAPRRTHRTAR